MKKISLTFKVLISSIIRMIIVKPVSTIVFIGLNMILGMAVVIAMYIPNFIMKITYKISNLLYNIEKSVKKHTQIKESL